MNAVVKNDILKTMKASTILGDFSLLLEKGDPFVFDVTPDMADTILAVANNFNRMPSPGKIKQYGAAMRRGEWKYNGDSIRFYEKDYKLADGQHRLQAIADSKTTQKTLVVPNICHDAYLTIDCGKNRSARDAFMMLNHDNPTEKATACVNANKWMLGKMIRNQPTPSTTQVLAFEKAHADAISTSVKFGMELQTEFGRNINVGTLASALIIGYLAKGELAPDFMKMCEHFWTKAYDNKDEPVYQLIRLVDRHNSSKTIAQGKLTAEGLIGSILRAWKLTRTKKKATTYNDVMYPSRKNEPFSSVL